MKTVSIVIPCRNEENYIIRCLNSIMVQDYADAKVEVFVCDGISTDSTVTHVEKHIASHPNVHLLKNEKQTTPYALNLGINASKSDVVIILGAHSELYPNYVSKCIEAFSFETQIGCTGGVIENVYENETAEVIGKAMSSSFGVGNAHFRTGNRDGIVDTVAFGAYKREVFDKVGLFDEELIRNQDDELNYRVTSAGYKIYLYNEIRSKYYVRASYKKLFKQYEQYGYWKVYVNKKHKTVTTFRQLVPLFFVLYLILGVISFLFGYLFLVSYLIGLLLYAVGGFLFAWNSASRNFQIPHIQKVFFILHFSYGWGYLKGIIDFFILGKKIKKSEALTR